MDGHPLLESISTEISKLVAECCPDVGRPGLLVGLSGGPDSVTLLLAAKVWADSGQGAVEALHLNHRLRPSDDRQDQTFCRELCGRLGVPLHETQADPRPLARLRGQGLEEAGRQLRLQALARIVSQNDHLDCAATGHHRDDQVETVIMRLFRGTGPDGLPGIRPRQGPLLHPLLGVTRQQILNCLECLGQPWRTDSTNIDGSNTRARLRRELLPVIREIFGAGAEAGPARLGSLLEQDLKFLTRLGSEALNEVTLPEDADTLSVTGLLALDPALASRVLRIWLAPPEQEWPAAGTPRAGLERVHVDRILTWVQQGQSGSGLDLPGGVRLVREFDRLRRQLSHRSAISQREAGDYRILVRKSDSSVKSSDGPECHELTGSGDLADQTSWNLTCPADVLVGNLKVRNWEQGDRFQPFGLAGTKLLSDLLRERRIPADQRQGILVVCDEAGILWVVGLARAERTRLLPSPTRTVTISIVRRTENRNQGN